MPNHYCFHKPDGVMAQLDDVDRQLCELTGAPYSATKFCPAFQWVQLVGDIVLIKQSASTVTPEVFDAYKARCDSGELKTPGIETPDEWDILRRFLAVDYHYEAWATIGK
jgi:hypothetical protein